ncbi:MAG: hypothetical protein KGI78_00635 [Patescibacteria group bacterium]|nr:hypothetical protein [Patescibacteria group bacterium]MDE1944272.1 hypothetical protein [Patescibacteria group bacterium]MDE1944659.1 hypothetical protein [Patescibacteria group bacterium]MDE2057345.1 hypothetical protein [Patescibacteria group bacterium]
MDSDPVLKKLNAVERELRSLRATFGAVLIILILLLILATGPVVKLFFPAGVIGAAAASPAPTPKAPGSAEASSTAAHPR